MTLTAEERSAINRQNAAHATGPKTDEGKARSRANALKHGLRAEVLALPDEDPEVIQARADEWDDYYRPQSPAARHLVTQCVRATLMADRCDRFHTAAVGKQVREAVTRWDIAQDEEVTALFDLLKVDPRTAERRLSYTAEGCRRMIARWEELQTALHTRGCWTDADRDDAIRLQGYDPDPATFKESLGAWSTRLYNLLAAPTPVPSRGTPSPVETHVAFLFDPARIPDAARAYYRADKLPERAWCKGELRTLVAERLASLRQLEASLRSRIEEPDRAGAADRAAILHDGPTARLFLRYQAESRVLFHRAYGQLLKTLEIDIAASAPAVTPVSPNEPNAPAPAVSPNEPNAPAPAVSPNEPNAVARVSPNEPNPAPARVSPNEPTSARPASSASAPAVSPNEPNAVVPFSPNEPNALAPAVSPNEPNAPAPAACGVV